MLLQQFTDGTHNATHAKNYPTKLDQLHRTRSLYKTYPNEMHYYEVLDNGDYYIWIYDKFNILTEKLYNFAPTIKEA